jgi:hypothetical protein
VHATIELTVSLNQFYDDKISGDYQIMLVHLITNSRFRVNVE